MPDTLQTPAGHVRLGSNSGQPMTRRDGVAKVTGAATYAADNRPDGLAHAVFTSAGIARGRVLSLNIEAAKSHPGVIEVITPDNRPALHLDPDGKSPPFSWRIEARQVQLFNSPLTNRTTLSTYQRKQARSQTGFWPILSAISST